ncbi:hypothetical protein DPMN_160015 [Dreissena polymorpha]|uniref:Uncharacterized protein n=1 Tax=Dreissena polymorpha TaxID=45954 RepID=A0A9D4IR85_DREPO|nr:hypothetical protein DPMN_160015 [Dreissena polymorpha]
MFMTLFKATQASDYRRNSEIYDDAHELHITAKLVKMELCLYNTFDDKHSVFYHEMQFKETG